MNDTRSTSTLPPEIYAEIIDHFAACIPQYPSTEYLDSLQAVSLTCQTFLPLARAHIFRQIDISSTHDISGDRRTNLVSFLDKEPHVARSVEHVFYSFNEGEEHRFKKPMEGLLRCVTSLPRMKNLSIAAKRTEAADSLIWLILDPPAFGWNAILNAFISRSGIVLDTVSLSGSMFCSLYGISTTPSARNLVLNSCALRYHDEKEVQMAVDTNRFTLNSLSCHDRERILVSVAFIAQCTELSELILRCDIYYPGDVKDLPAYIGFNSLSVLPFQKLKRAKLDGRFPIQWGFFLACATTRGAGVIAFPELKDLSMGMSLWTDYRAEENASDSLTYEIFKHMPVLETLEIHGFPGMPVDISKALSPLSPTLKILSLHCDFEDRAFEGDSDIKLPQFLNTLERLDLAVLESLSLHIQLKTGIYKTDKSTTPPRSVHDAVAQSVFHTINNVLLRNYLSHFSSLKKMEVKITMMVYKNEDCDEPEEEAPYRRNTITTLRRYLSRIDADGKFEFVWEVDVFRRCFQVAGQPEEEVEGDGGETCDEDVAAI